MNLKLSSLKQKRGYDGEYDGCFELNQFKNETFKLPNEHRQARVQSTF